MQLKKNESLHINQIPSVRAKSHTFNLPVQFGISFALLKFYCTFRQISYLRCTIDFDRQGIISREVERERERKHRRAMMQENAAVTGLPNAFVPSYIIL